MNDFDLEGGRNARDEGIELVLANNADWAADLFEIILSLPCGWRGRTENLRMIAEPLIGSPLNENAYGGVMNVAGRKGFLTRTGVRQQNKRIPSHARMTEEYIRCFGECAICPFKS